MSAEPMMAPETTILVNRRPRIALMGEFSAGKSTLANLLLGQSVSPVKVTATQLPPVWYQHGPEAVCRIDNSGAEIPIASQDLDTVSHRETQAVRICLNAEVLEFCDVIDMPGTSDPNMPSEIWERMLTRVDGVIWCTPSTQAWRQSEAALWQCLPARFHNRSLLLITRMDKLLSESDRKRVVARVTREADGLFDKVLPISLTEAIAARDNPDVLQRCGADQFVESLIELVESFGTPKADERLDAFGPVGKAAKPAPPIVPVPTAPKPGAAASADQNDGPRNGVVPRRVIPKRIKRADARRPPT
ncbi:dynamin family protein [Cognatishimia sp. F0-27]|uniref:dynamin family protein n=1 Tax=Cognatishimia sp. F0-27 TaxID=2816855 RepID=UPI001D0BFBF2|nr:dynamin family protein [Cognatishimia sp. F0-27]MCC1493800.1 dynamin family protein [Cognatishimia sp. F0-27]